MQDAILHVLSQVLRVPLSKIDVCSSFMELGGHSLSAIALKSECKQRGILLSVESILSSPNISTLIERALPEPSSQRQSQLDHTFNGCTNSNLHAKSLPIPLPETAAKMAITSKPGYPPHSAAFPSKNASRAVPMTEMQLSLIHGSQKQPGTNIIYHTETFRPEDMPAMRRAWQTVVEMEPIFGATFDLSNGLLIGHPKASFCWSEVSVNDERSYDAEIEKELLRPTNSIKFKVINLAVEDPQMSFSTIVWSVSHALIDGYSASLVLNKVRRAAAGLSNKPGTSFFKVAGDLRNLQKALHSEGQKFWEDQAKKFSGAVGELLLSTPSSQMFSNSNHTETISFEVPLDTIGQCAQSSQVTLASLYHAAWALTLSMFADSDVVVFGAVLSGRNLALSGVEDSIGPLVNTLPLHVLIDRTRACSDYLREIFAHLVELMSFQWTTPENGYTRHFSSALAMQFDVLPTKYDTVIPISRPRSTITSDIPLSLLIDANGAVQLQYHTITYKKSDVALLGEIFRNALQGLCTPNHTVGMCLESMLSCRIQENLYRMGNCLSGLTTVASVKDDLVSLFELATKQNPGEAAVEKGTSIMSYSELRTAAHRVADTISPMIKDGDVVCVHADQSINWVVAIYGVLIAGGVYCPLVATLPAELRDSMYISARSTLFLTPSSAQKSFKPNSCSSCLAVEDLLSTTRSEAAQVVTAHREWIPRPSATAYLCFTSGSTGKPKGVLCSHEGLVAFERDLEVRLFSRPGCKIAQIMSPAFDGSIHELFSALSYGGTLVLQSSTDLFEHLQSVDATILTPSIARVLNPEDFPKLKTVYLVGEPVSQDINDRWALKKDLYNMYGPTEATCGATIKRLLHGQPVTIGSPNHSTRVYILDSRQSLVPPGVIGDIYLAGVQISRGYIGRPEETAKSFSPDLIRSGLGERMYRTGDRGYWNEIGDLVCLGRHDRQIKLRGFRLDLNDIEIRMAQANAGVRAVAVAVKEDYLVAMVQPASVDIAEFRSNIARILPAHAVPRYFAAVDKFPMTSAGKLDYKAIQNEDFASIRTVKPRLNKPFEKVIAAAWRDILHLDPTFAIHRDSNFFDLGGHSIMQLLLGSRLNTILEQRIPFRIILESRTLGDLAQAISQLDSHAPSKYLLSGDNHGDHELSPIERDWWHKYELDEGSSAFNVSFACNFDPAKLDPSTLTAAWNTVLARHRILRCRYVKHRREGVRRVYSGCSQRVQRVSYLDIWKEIHRPFLLQKTDPIRVSISANQMVVTVSHIVCDLTTLDVLLREVATLCGGVSLPPVKKTYMETSLWNNLSFDCDLAFWTSYLEDLPEFRSQIDNAKDRSGYRGSSHLCKFDVRTYHRILDFAQRQKVTLHQISLAAIALALQYDSEDTDIVLGGPYFNRKSDDELEVVGLFLEPLPIRVKYSQKQPAEPGELFIQSVQKASQDALAHAVPWDQLLHHLRITPDYLNPPLLETMVTFHDNRNADKFPIAGVEPLYTWTEGSKFKLMVEFCALSGEKLVMRLEHDSDIYSAGDIKRIETLIIKAFDCLVAEMAYSDIKAQLRQTDEAADVQSHQQLFGVKLADL